MPASIRNRSCSVPVTLKSFERPGITERAERNLITEIRVIRVLRVGDRFTADRDPARESSTPECRSRSTRGRVTELRLVNGKLVEHRGVTTELPILTRAKFAVAATFGRVEQGLHCFATCKLLRVDQDGGRGVLVHRTGPRFAERIAQFGGRNQSGFHANFSD
jgi:hypothetical protein